MLYSYITVDDPIQHIIDSGPGSLLAKIDIRGAFRLIPVHPSDRHLLSMLWEPEGGICICNSVARSEIWDKFHECCSENGKNCTRRSRVQFCHSHYNTSEIYPKISLLAMLLQVNTIDSTPAITEVSAMTQLAHSKSLSS